MLSLLTDIIIWSLAQMAGESKRTGTDEGARSHSAAAFVLTRVHVACSEDGLGAERAGEACRAAADILSNTGSVLTWRETGHCRKGTGGGGGGVRGERRREWQGRGIQKRKEAGVRGEGERKN